MTKDEAMDELEKRLKALNALDPQVREKCIEWIGEEGGTHHIKEPLRSLLEPLAKWAGMSVDEYSNLILKIGVNALKQLEPAELRNELRKMVETEH